MEGGLGGAHKQGNVDEATTVSHAVSTLAQILLLFTLSLFNPAATSSSWLQFLGANKRRELFG